MPQRRSTTKPAGVAAPSGASATSVRATKKASPDGHLTPRAGREARREDSKAIVEAILRAAAELENPDASLATIAARAGVGVASVHRYFPGRSAIYTELIRRQLQQVLEGLRSVLARPHGSLDLAVLEACRIATAGGGLNLALRHRLNAAVPMSWSIGVIDSVYRTAIGEIQAWLGRNLESPPPDLGERVFMAFAACRGIAMLTVLFPDLAPPAGIVEQRMASAALAMLRHDGAVLRLRAR